MSEPLFDQSYALFCIGFTRAVVAWNNAEEAARDILSSLSSGNLGATIAIYQLGNVSLVDALRTVSTFLRSMENPLAHERAEHVEHFIDGLDRLRAYRNFYVHALRGVGKDEGAEAASGMIYGVEVKGGYSYVKHNLELGELLHFARHCSELQDYGREIASNVTRNALAQFSRPPPTPLASLQKPTWPDKLKKNRENLLTPKPPPGSSAE